MSTIQPIVGISGANADSKSVTAMIAQVRQAGGIPMLLAKHGNRSAREDLKKIDSLIMMGNDNDISAELYLDKYPDGDPRKTKNAHTKDENETAAGAARANYESQLLLAAMEQKIPTLNICGAMHRLNVLTGGTLLQHIPELVGNSHHEQNTDHIAPVCPVMPVDIATNSNLGKVAGEISMIYMPSYPPNGETITSNENSFHHQAVDGDYLNKNFRAVAYSDHYTKPDGNQARLVEAFEPAKDGKLKDWKMLSVQWHPEFGASPLSPKLIADVVENGRERAPNSNRDHSMDEMIAQAETSRSAGAEGFLSRLNASRNQPRSRMAG